MAVVEYGLVPVEDHERVAVFAGVTAYAGELATSRLAEFAIDFGVHDHELAVRDTFVTVVPPGADPEQTRTSFYSWGFGATVRCETAEEIVDRAAREPREQGTPEDPPALAAARNLMHATTAARPEGNEAPAGLKAESKGSGDQSIEAPGIVVVRSAGVVPVVAQLVTRLSAGAADVLRQGGMPRSWVMAHFHSDTGRIERQVIAQDGRSRLCFEQTVADGRRIRFDMGIVPVDESDGELCHITAAVTAKDPGAGNQRSITVRDEIQQVDDELIVVRTRTFEGSARPYTRPTEAAASDQTILSMADAAVGSKAFPNRVWKWGV